MDGRIVIGALVGLVLLAFGGFYFALSSRSNNVVVAAVRQDRRPRRAFSASQPGSPLHSGALPRGARTRRRRAGKATPASIEDEIAHSDHAELQALLKKYFTDDYNQLITVAVQRRNEGVSDQDFGQELFGRFQDIMRSKLRYAAGASTPMIDRLAANEAACSTRSAPKARLLPEGARQGRRRRPTAAAGQRPPDDAARHALSVPGHRRGLAEFQADRPADQENSRPSRRAQSRRLQVRRRPHRGVPRQGRRSGPASPV